MIKEMWVEEFYTDENMGKSVKVIPKNGLVKPIRVIRYDILLRRLKQLNSYFEQSHILLDELRQDLGVSQEEMMLDD